MPLPGGASDKYGNRYEGKWTARCLAMLLNEEFECIQLEPPGPEGEGCEFTISKGTITQYHQVKRQHSFDSSWTISKLCDNGVLKTAFLKTIDKKNEFVFISTVSANLLNELADASRNADNLESFKSNFISGDKGNTWKTLIDCWHSFIAGAKLIAIAQFYFPAAIPLTEECITGTEHHRKGVAEVAATNLCTDNCNPFCKNTLKILFNDESKEVRSEASHAFSNAKGRDLESCKDLIVAFTESKSFLENLFYITHYIEESTADLDEEILIISTALITQSKIQKTENPNSFFHHGDSVAELLLRTYRQSNNPDFQKRCLDLIDELLRIEISGISKELEEFER